MPSDKSYNNTRRRSGSTKQAAHRTSKDQRRRQEYRRRDEDQWRDEDRGRDEYRLRQEDRGRDEYRLRQEDRVRQEELRRQGNRRRQENRLQDDDWRREDDRWRYYDRGRQENLRRDKEQQRQEDRQREEARRRQGNRRRQENRRLRAEELRYEEHRQGNRQRQEDRQRREEHQGKYAGNRKSRTMQERTTSSGKGAPKRIKKKNRRKQKFRLTAIWLVELLIVFVLLGLIFLVFSKLFEPVRKTVPVQDILLDNVPEPESETEIEHETEKILTADDIIFQPHSVASTEPGNLIDTTEILVDNELYEDVSSYRPAQQISFELPDKYTNAEGVITFRGDNFRNSPAYGLAEMTENKLESAWSADTGGLTIGDSVWTGSGWTGQPLITKWSKEVRAHMNLYDWAKAKEELIEVIYACMDGYVYFLDKDTGEATRDAMYLGFVFKGSGALDPRGYPILYVGSGYDTNEGISKAFIINLMDCSIMYTFGCLDPFSYRGDLSYFDSSALVDAETDTLIYPGENGILYLIHLNSSFDPATGSLSVDPDHVVKWHYYGNRTSISSYWVGMEDSAVIFKGYLFIADNGGNLMCLDLNTLRLVWVQDILDDSNGTPVMMIEDGHPYLYISTSFHLGWRSSDTAKVPIWKIDAETGEIVWQTDYTCYSVSGVSGGVQSTIAVGEHKLSDYIYVTVSRTGEEYNGVLACLNKYTGEKVWEHKSYYAWSSPVCVYNSEGDGNVLYCTCGGIMFLLDGLSGKELDQIVLSEGAIESSPAVYEDLAVVGTRACKIWGVKLK